MSGDDYYKERIDAGNVVEVEHGDGPMHTRSEATSGGAHISMAGLPQQNEEGTRDVCRRLAEAIKDLTGEDWQPDAERPPGPEVGVDWYLRSSKGGVWGVQVTRVGSLERWARSARGERVVEWLSAAAAAGEIWEALERKTKFHGGILALDVGQPGAHAFQAAVEEFSRIYGQRVSEQVRFSEVWLVGYSPATTLRIHAKAAV